MTAQELRGRHGPFSSRLQPQDLYDTLASPDEEPTRFRRKHAPVTRGVVRGSWWLPLSRREHEQSKWGFRIVMQEREGHGPGLHGTDVPQDFA